MSVMCENVSVFRALQSVIAGGLNHKGVAVRAEVARLMVLLVEALGSARVMGSSSHLFLDRFLWTQFFNSFEGQAPKAEFTWTRHIDGFEGRALG